MHVHESQWIVTVLIANVCAIHHLSSTKGIAIQKKTTVAMNLVSCPLPEYFASAFIQPPLPTHFLMDCSQ